MVEYKCFSCNHTLKEEQLKKESDVFTVVQRLSSNVDLLPQKCKRFKMLSATIKIENSAKEIQQLFELEEKEFANKRASYKTIRNGDTLLFEIKAKDSVALRSVLNTITKIITVYENTKGALKNVK